MPFPHGLAIRARPRVAHLQAKAPQKWRNIATAPAIDHTDPFVPPPQSSPSPSLSRQEKIRAAAPFSAFLTDTHSRQHNYLRISLTERCNLRCTYCMPSEGVALSPNRDILTTPEIVYLSALFVNQGVTKIRLTGGEPTVRKDILPLMQQIGDLRRNGLKELALTTNGISLHRKLEGMVEAGLTGVNISLDTLDPLQFPILTRRNGFEAVMRSIERVKELNRAGAGIKLKINVVAMRGVNDDQIIPFVAMTETEDLEVRFIEYMPFGGNKWSQKKMLPYEKIRERIQEKWPAFSRMRDEKNAVSKTWKVPGWAGRVGFITSMTEDFCSTCNRLRITSDGNLKVCLHGNTEVSLRDLLRAEGNGEPMDEAAFEALRELELQRISSTGDEGWVTKERQLLDVIGAAVKRKKAKHAGMGELENMENRPMILIGKRKATSLSSSPPLSSWSSPPMRSSARTHPWSSIPTHLLYPGSLQSQARLYSSKTDDTDPRSIDYFEQIANEPEPSGAKDEASPEDISKPSDGILDIDEAPMNVAQHEASKTSEAASPAVASPTSPQDVETSVSETLAAPAVGFQSLSGLVPRPRPISKRVENHRSRREEDHPTRIDESSFDTRSSSDNTSAWSKAKRSSEDYRFATPVTSGSGNESPAPYSLPKKPFGENDWAWDQDLDDDGDEMKFEPVSSSPPKSPNPFTSTLVPKSPNPFASPSVKTLQEGKDFKRVVVDATLPVKPVKPWGLTTEEAVAATTTPQSKRTQPQSAATKEEKTPAKVASSSSSKSPSPETSKSKPAEAGKLTHLTSSGEAHMVDVGTKASTRRVAIAFGNIRFSNNEPLRLISENANKKGDVLSVARIAGIMSAKRTSSIIPLCHPIPLTKISLDINIGSAEDSIRYALYQTPSKNCGVVTIQAIVECEGKTGVEMEALMAVSGALLTVYDMCKAVDRKMVVEGMRVVFKSGGRSGLFVDGKWRKWVGEEFFRERGLEMLPGAVGKKESPAEEKSKLEEKLKHEEKPGPEPVAEDASQPVPSSPGIRKVSLGEPILPPPHQFAKTASRTTKEDYRFLVKPSPRSPGTQSPQLSQTTLMETTSPNNSNNTKSPSQSIHRCPNCLRRFTDRRERLKHLVDEHGYSEEDVEGFRRKGVEVARRRQNSKAGGGGT